MDQTGRCFCPFCLHPLEGVVEMDEHVWLSRCCPDHGLVRTMLYRATSYLAAAQLPIPPSWQRHRCLVVEVTERCDVGCATCSASSTSLGREKPVGDMVRDAFAAATVIGARVVALSGGEPLIRADVWEIADAFHARFPKVVLITSGRNFELRPRILAEIAARREWLELYLQFDSLQDDVLKAIRTPHMNAKLRRQRLELAVATGAATTAVCVVPPDIPEESITELAVFCHGEGAAGVTFQPLRRLGRFPKNRTKSDTPLATVDHIQGLALRALGAEEATPMPFTQQPFDISVAFLAGKQVVHSDAFFEESRQRVFRVATSSYWDHTNYFEPFAQSGRFYFFADVDTPLNARYFGPARQARPALRQLYG